MENLLLNFVLSNTLLIVIISVLWYVLGLIYVLWMKYYTDGIISVLDLFLGLISGILGPFIIIIYLLIKHEWFDDVIICKRKK